MDETKAPLYSDTSGSDEVAVGGVYLRLFIQNPGWLVQRPKEFMVELFERWTQLSTSQNVHVSDSGVGGWRVEVGGWRVEVGRWRVEVGGW